MLWYRGEGRGTAYAKGQGKLAIEGRRAGGMGSGKRRKGNSDACIGVFIGKGALGVAP